MARARTGTCGVRTGTCSRSTSSTSTARSRCDVSTCLIQEHGVRWREMLSTICARPQRRPNHRQAVRPHSRRTEHALERRADWSRSSYSVTRPTFQRNGEDARRAVGEWQAGVVEVHEQVAPSAKVDHGPLQLADLCTAVMTAACQWGARTSPDPESCLSEGSEMRDRLAVPVRRASKVRIETCGLSVRRDSSHSAATPATCGVAMLVPSLSVSPPPRLALRIRAPGATTRGDVMEKLAT